MKKTFLLLVLAIAGCSSVNLEVLTPLEQPWPSEISRDRLIEAALYETFLYLDNQEPSCEPDYTFFMAESFHADHVAMLYKATDSFLTFFCNDLKKPVYIVGGKSEFVQQAVLENSIPSDEFGGACGVPIEKDGPFTSMYACAWSGSLAWIGDSIGTVRFGEPMLDESGFSTAIHEIAHLVQDQTFDSGGQTLPRPNDKFLPVWMIEGGAEYLSESVLAYLDMKEYGWMAPLNRSGSPTPLALASDLKVFETWDSGDIAYYSGQVATEYVIASVGFEAYLNILRNMSKNGGNFDYSFEEAIGISLPEFYNKFEKMHLNLYDGKVVGGS